MGHQVSEPIPFPHLAQIATMPLDRETLLAAELIVRRRIRATKWAQEARVLKLAADDIHKEWERRA